MTFQERYQYNPSTNMLGKGGFARVYKATDTLLDREVAIKVFNVNDNGQYTVIDEIKKAIHLEHPNLLRYYDVAVVENTSALGEKQTIQIGVMEYANAGDLKNFSRQYPNSPHLFSLLKQVLSGLEYLHKRGIIHRDLKPQNILLTEHDGILTAKISDFGISKLIESGTNSSSMAIGTIEYMAPEQFNPNKYGINGKIGTNVDLWSFGIMVHELLTDEPLFGQRSGNITAEQIMNAILSDSLPADIDSLPEPYKAVVKRCLVTDAKKRAQKAAEIVQLLNTGNRSSGDVAAAETMVLDNTMFPERQPTVETKFLPGYSERNKMNKEEGEIDEGKSKKNKWLVYGALLLIIAAAVYFLFFNNASPVTNNNLTKHTIELDSLKQKLEEKKYQEIINTLKDSVTAAGGPHDTSATDKYIPVYVKALLENGDTSGAIPFLQKPNMQGNTDFAVELGFLYYGGRFMPVDYAKAATLFKKGADAGNHRAETMMGNIYFMGLTSKGRPDYGEAIRYYFKASDHGDPVAMYALGLAYNSGQGVQQNSAEARKWFNKVLEKNDNPQASEAARFQLNQLDNK